MITKIKARKRLKLLNILPDGTEVYYGWCPTLNFARLNAKKTGIVFNMGHHTFFIPLTDWFWEGKPVKMSVLSWYNYKPLKHWIYKKRIRGLKNGRKEKRME